MDTCRICLQHVVETEKAIHLFCDSEKSKEILQRIFLCSQVELSIDEYLPRVLCNDCNSDLTVAYNFRLKCIKADANVSAASVDGYETVSVPFPNELQNAEFINNLTYDDLIQNCNTSTSPHSVSDSKDKSLSTGKINKDLQRKRIKTQTQTGGCSQTTRKYICSKCPYSTPYSQTLVNHYRKHTGERPYHCYCGKKFSQNAGLAAHKKTHSNVACCTCSICGKQFKHYFSLKKHLQVHEDGSFACGVCEKSLKSLKSLQSHVNRHNNVRNYNCEDCGATFVTSSELINHRKTHNVEKNIECNLCGYKTHTKKVMILHLKRHAGDKRYNCTMCDVACYTKGELQTHLRVHTREKPYSCPVCCQKFRHSPSVNKHMRNVHRLTFKWGDAKPKKVT